MRTLWVLMVLLTAGMTSSYADSESNGAAAERAGKYREALNRYTEALQGVTEGSTKDQELREKIILLANQMKPAPAIPDEATRSLVRGRTAFKIAQDRDAFGRAADEFRQVAKKAPWLAEAYYNLGAALDKAERYPEAVRALKLYLLADPHAKDKAKVNEFIYELEYKQEEAGRKARNAITDAAKAKEERLGNLIQSLAGRWFEQFSSAPCGTWRNYYRLVPSSGNALVLEYSGEQYIQRAEQVCSTSVSTRSFQLRVGDNFSLDGSGSEVLDFTNDNIGLHFPQCRFIKTLEFTAINGVVSSDGASITISYQAPQRSGICSFGPGIDSRTLNLRRDR